MMYLDIGVDFEAEDRKQCQTILRNDCLSIFWSYSKVAGHFSRRQ